MSKFADLNTEALDALFSEKHTEFQKFTALETPTDEQVEQAEALATEIEEIVTERDERKAAAAAKAAKFDALKNKTFGVEDEADEETDGDEDEEEATEEEAPAEAEAPAEEEAPVEAAAKPVKAAQTTKTVASIAKKAKRPETPKQETNMLSIVASANVDGFNAGQTLPDLDAVGRAVVAKMRGFAPPSGDGSREDLQKFGVASIRLPFDDDLIIDRGSDDMEVLSRAGDEKRLNGNSLVAAGGWCSPSETLYDLASDESLEGILSVPEVQVKRGGIRYTTGPQFSDFYAEAGFIQTEAQAIAGTTKPCYEVDCPAFTDVRLDAVGVCIKVPILTNAAWPELTNRFTSGTMIAHQHMVNANVIGRMVTLAGAARVITGLGSSVGDAMGALELLADERREAYRLPLGRTLEVVVPFWLKGNFRSDLANRNGVGADAISDAQIAAHWTARNLSVQYVYDWQPIGQTEEVYPETVNVLMYPAGTFIKGVSDVINLSAVYDAASLAVNTYTGLFMEQGLLVAKKQYDADLITLPLYAGGRTGPADFAPVAGSWATGVTPV